MLVEKAAHKWTIIDIAVPRDFTVVRTEDWKVQKYQDLAFKVETAILPFVLQKQCQGDSSGQLSF